MSVQSVQSSAHVQSPAPTAAQAQTPVELAWQKGLQDAGSSLKAERATFDNNKFNKLIGEKSVNLMIQVSMTRTQPQIKGIDDDKD